MPKAARFGTATLIALVLVACTTAPDGTVVSTSTAPPAATSQTSPLQTSVSQSTVPASTPTTSDKLNELIGLPFSEFLESSFELLLLRRPEFLTSLGVAADYGRRNDRLDDWSPEFLAETQALEAGILDLLREYDRDRLSEADRISFDVYEWYLDQRVRGHRFAYHDYPVHYFVNSYNFNLILFLSEEHPLETVDDAEDYVARLAGIENQVAQVLERLRISEEMGVTPPAVIVDWTIGSLQNDLGGTGTASEVLVRRLPLYTSFEQRLAEIDGLDDPVRLSLLERAEDELATSFVPAWISLIDHMTALTARAGSDAGVWRLPDGDDYYQYLLRDHTSTDLTAAEIHAIGLDAVERVQAELRAAFDDLGYPSDAPIDDLLARAADDAGSLGGSETVIAAYEGLIADAEETAGEYFNVWPSAAVGVVPEPAGQGGYYVAASVDGSRPGAFHAGVDGTVSLYRMPTITYHEAVPGHHTQIAVAQELDLPTFRRFIQYNGFAEGWALYAERLASEIGLYEDDPYGNIGRLELELLRAVRLVVDTGIHSLRWTRNEARAYMRETIPGWSHEVERYMVFPGQATGYMIGMQTILDLRDRWASVMDGEALDLAAFHDLILGGGSLPLGVLEATVEEVLGG